MKAYTLASTINIDENEKIHKIWNELDLSCQMSEIKYAPIPHFSYMTFNKISDKELLKNSLQNISGQLEPFEIQISGLGIFKGEEPILYLPVVRTKKLSDVHSLILSEISDYISETSDFYSEENWIPHITLAIRDINLDNISCAIEQCLQFQLSFRLKVDHIAILYMDENTFGIEKSFALVQ